MPPPQRTIVQLHPGSKLDRTVPATMQAFVPSKEWIEFCSKIDAVSTRLNNVFKYVALSFGGFFVGAILTGVGIMRLASCTSGFYSCNFAGVSAFVVIGPIILFGSVGYSIYSMIKMGKNSTNELNAACEEFSKKFEGVTIHYKTHTTIHRSSGGSSSHHGIHHGTHQSHVSSSSSSHTDHYLEILTTEDASSPKMPSEIPVAVDAVAVDSGSTDHSYHNTASSPAIRMRELEQMKGMIAIEEYEAKRKEILQSV